MWSANDKSMSYDQVKKDASAAKKNMKLVRLTLQKDLSVNEHRNKRSKGMEQVLHNWNTPNLT